MPEPHSTTADHRARLPKVAEIAERHFRRQCREVWRRTDHLFAGLLILEWLAGIALAFWVTPQTWIGATSSLHIHVLVAIFLGGIISALPVFLAVFRPSQTLTRHVIAVSQMLFSALLVDLTGGRIETPFPHLRLARLPRVLP